MSKIIFHKLCRKVNSQSQFVSSDLVQGTELGLRFFLPNYWIKVLTELFIFMVTEQPQLCLFQSRGYPDVWVCSRKHVYEGFFDVIWNVHSIGV